MGAGAFGTALAVTLARTGQEVTLWARDPGTMHARRESPRLPGTRLPAALQVTGDAAALERSDTILLAVPMQALSPLLAAHPGLWPGRVLVACCKGIDLARLTGPSRLIRDLAPGAVPAVLTGPGFAADLARGLPTAMTLACADPGAAALQARLSTPVLRLYLSDDLTGAELGGALKNVIALAAGAVIGAGLGDSARAATMTRGFAEMTRAAAHLGARPETLTGLSGFGDLVLTCTSEQSRNYRSGLALGRGEALDPALTVEGAATARAMARLAEDAGIDLPITRAVAALVAGEVSVRDALAALMARPLKQE
ncbi:NAD(P)H-dependent glycerol-3-phosphate dehydrogenase [Mangrovicoccus algicola]|uniref:Glycerol-3-phosphate dehydrogenase [NAD(P)+] n=1 Tax=Mangrovicoccus algicola TaxID=2771008 RepID=A0A8J6YW97_9RHOB|nr:NAD(P)H-dependent glycerol-3-phosphate dehydrogenase [Mangrovicoccus algicola]MBE3638912.1 NAD(P)-dependent glycerol-3-phosphate dehydrogenase [Mangrovicoccus algicola]